MVGGWRSASRGDSGVSVQNAMRRKAFCCGSANSGRVRLHLSKKQRRGETLPRSGTSFFNHYWFPVDCFSQPAYATKFRSWLSATGSKSRSLRCHTTVLPHKASVCIAFCFRRATQNKGNVTVLGNQHNAAVHSLGHGFRLFRPATFTHLGQNDTNGSSSRRSAGSSSINERQVSSDVVVCVSSPRSQCEAFRTESAVYARSRLPTDVAAPRHSEEVHRQPAFDMIIILIPFQDYLLSADHAQCGSRCHDVVDRVKPTP